VKSGDKPAAVNLIFLTKHELTFKIIEILKQSLKHSETRAICGLGPKWYEKKQNE
jgi:hypothetical protein